MSGQTPLGVAVVGLGVGEQHARVFASLPECSLRWVIDFDNARAARIAADLSVPRYSTVYEDALADRGVDLVCIATYDDMHYRQVMASLASGKHIFVEKPLCQTHEEVLDIKKLWESSGGRLALMSNLVLRAAPLYRRLREALRSGVLGKIYAIDAEYLYGRLHKITNGWRARVPNYAVMAGGGVHMIDIAMWLTGSRPVWVRAEGNRICTEGTAFRYMDYVTVTAGYADGSIARFTANFGCVHRHQHVLRLYGTEATFFYDDAGARLHVSRDPAVPPEPWYDPPLPPSKGALIPDFVRGIAEGRDWRAEVQAALDVISVCAACEESLKQGQNIQVKYS